MPRPVYLSRFPLWLWLIALAGVLLSLAIAQQARDQADAAVLQRLAFSADQITLRIEERLAAHVLVLHGASALFGASNRVDRTEWHTFVTRLLASTQLDNIAGIGFVRYVPAEQLADHLASLRAEGVSDYALTPAGEREAYGPVHFIEPFDQHNRTILGYDMLAEPTRRAAMRRAHDTGQATLSGPVELVPAPAERIDMPTEPRPAMLMYLPVYRRNVPLASVTQRRHALRGWVYMPYRMDDLIAGILTSHDRSDDQPLALSIHADHNGAQGELLYRNTPPSAFTSTFTPTFTQQRRLVAYGQAWHLTFQHRQPATAIDHSAAWWRLFGGLTLTSLLCALIASLLSTRARALRMSQELTQAIRQREAQLEQAVSHLQTLAHHDALTGLPNRMLLTDRLNQAMAHEQRLARRLAVVYMDLDGFKTINDRFGHAAGDHLLATLARRLHQVIRTGDTLSRLGGDEFVAVLVNLTDTCNIEPLLQRLLEAAAQPVCYEGQCLSVSASMGVTYYPQAGGENIGVDQLLHQADQAMYQAKLAGKGRYHFFAADPDSNTDAEPSIHAPRPALSGDDRPATALSNDG